MILILFGKHLILFFSLTRGKIVKKIIYVSVGHDVIISLLTYIEKVAQKRIILNYILTLNCFRCKITIQLYNNFYNPLNTL